MINHNLEQSLPDYRGGSLVNLMSSIGARFGATRRADYPQLGLLPQARLDSAKRIALVVIDGLGAELLNHLSQTDGSDGSLAALKIGEMTSVYPPTTASAVTSYMSGLAPQQHGLTGWFMNFRKLGAVAAVLPFMPRHSRVPLAGMGITPAQLIDAPSFADSITATAAALLPSELAESAYSQLLGAGAERQGYHDLNDFAGKLSSFCCGGSDADYLYAYWPELDHLSHIHGPSGNPVAAHFTGLEAALAPLAEQAAANGTLLLITADHGFIDSGPQQRIDLESHPDLAAMLTLPLCGEPRSAYAYVQRHSQDAFERYIKRELGHAIALHPAEELVDAGWFGLGTAHPELLPRLGDYVLCMRENYTLRDNVVGERDFQLHGVHGGISAAEQLIPLLVAGP